MLKTIIIEDNLDAEEKLRFLLNKYCQNNIQLLASANSGKLGIEAITTYQPNLLFLDVELGDMTAFELLDRIEAINFQVIFTTSHNHYAIKAIRYNALDYLVKPVGREELLAAVARAESKTTLLLREQIDQLTNHTTSKTALPEKIALSTSDGLIFIKIADIVRCESDRMYTNVNLISGERLMVSKPMGQLDELLNGHGFFRIHHSHLINMQHISKFVRTDGGYVVMADKTTIGVARNRKEEFLELFSKF